MNKKLETFLMYFLCFIYSVSQVFYLFYHLVQNGINVLKVKPRSDTPPPILFDKRWGNHQYINLKKQGVKLHYVQKGDTSKPLMLLLHGFPQCWFSFRHQIEEFSSEYWVVAVDMRGYGDSDKPKGKGSYTVDNVVGDIKELLTELGKPKCILVGHDWGGAIGWVLVDKYPQMFSHYISLNGPHMGVLRTLMQTNVKQFYYSWYIFFYQCPFLPEIMNRLKDMSFYVDHFRGPNNLVKEFPDDVLEGYVHYFSKKGAFTPPINYYRSSFAFDTTPTNGRIKVPTLILWGDKDRALSTAVPQYTLPLCEEVEYEEMKNVGHFIHEEIPTQVNERIRKYLNNK